MQMIKLVQQNLYISMELFLKKDMLSQVKLVGYMRMIYAKKVKLLNLYQQGQQQMIVDKGSLVIVGSCLLFLLFAKEMN
jgi:hypothetical protein